MFAGLRSWLCRRIGHRFSPTDVVIMMLRLSNVGFDGKVTLKCAICGKNIFPEIMNRYEKDGHKVKLPEGVTY